MRLNVEIYTLSACLIGLSAADEIRAIAPRQEGLGAGAGIGTGTATDQNRVVSFDFFPPLATPAVVQRTGNSTITFTKPNDVAINTVRLKLYNVNGSTGDDDEMITKAKISSSDQPPASSNKRDKNEYLTTSVANTVIIEWVKTLYNSDFLPQYIDAPLYLQCEWANSSDSGNSTTQLFAVYEKDSHKAAEALETTNQTSNTGGAPPARVETIQSSSPTASTTSVVVTTSATPVSSQPSSNAGTEAASRAPTGLSTNGIIGVAVGVGVGGLLVAGVLVWLFCFRRRKNATHHPMPSYGSEVGVHAIIRDKEIPAAIESSSPQSTYGGEGRPSTDQYAPYSDRSTTSPTPRHRSTSAAATAAAASTSETDLNWSQGAPTPMSVIASRYAHLVEEGMTEGEIRRLEEEERQLDAAIEHAGRRVNP